MRPMTRWLAIESLEFEPFTILNSGSARDCVRCRCLFAMAAMDPIVYELVILSIAALVGLMVALAYDQPLFAAIFAAQVAFAVIAAIRRARGR